ncbi:flagellar biosynthesis anti-sigma factor FlgM [Paenibacillus faecalis]|uniref:flagellar biosynthesis anti-sigma factor FlgM n=1 Tax=Paenibacillus faecalis TaxID=2079532 RepID=UPI000D0E4E25|nr:flagellar biosynthesis anti-sigma factor FlgM [Paenibacillus faecalis]
MKINDTGRVGAVHSYQRNMEAHRQEQQHKPRRKDEVSISPEAKEMLHAQERAGDPSRIEKIQALKEQVSSGTYRVSDEKLAEKLLPYFKQFPEN